MGSAKEEGVPEMQAGWVHAGSIGGLRCVRGRTVTEDEGGIVPSAPKRYCAHPGCSALVARGRCKAHESQRHTWVDSRRGTSSERGYDADWRKVRRAKLAAEPLCEECRKQKRIRVATEVHHIRTIEEAPELRLEWSNLMSLCKPCHSAIKDKGEVGYRPQGVGVG